MKLVFKDVLSAQQGTSMYFLTQARKSGTDFSFSYQTPALHRRGWEIFKEITLGWLISP